MKKSIVFGFVTYTLHLLGLVTYLLLALNWLPIKEADVYLLTILGDKNEICENSSKCKMLNKLNTKIDESLGDLLSLNLSPFLVVLHLNVQP